MAHTILSIFGLGTPEIILIVLVVLLLFGGRKIPELMRGLGKGIKSFKDGVSGSDNELEDDEAVKESKRNSRKPGATKHPDDKTPPKPPAG